MKNLMITKGNISQTLLRVSEDNIIILSIMKELSLEQMEEVEGGFLLLCAAGGPITFGVCLGVVLVLMTTNAY